MLLVTLQVVVLITAILIPLSIRKKNNRPIKYKIYTDTSNSLYAVNSFGTLEKINRLNTTDHKPEIEN